MWRKPFYYAENIMAKGAFPSLWSVIFFSSSDSPCICKITPQLYLIYPSGEIRFNGAVVTGTAEELRRFQKLDFIRASVIGATIDKKEDTLSILSKL